LQDDSGIKPPAKAGSLRLQDQEYCPFESHYGFVKECLSLTLIDFQLARPNERIAR
jgi:hypothetical protein